MIVHVVMVEVADKVVVVEVVTVTTFVLLIGFEKEGNGISKLRDLGCLEIVEVDVVPDDFLLDRVSSKVVVDFEGEDKVTVAVLASV